MGRLRVRLAIAVAALGVVATTAVAVAGDRDRGHGSKGFHTFLSGYEEVPALSTATDGSFRAAVDRAGEAIAYELRYGDFATDVLQAHIHFEQQTNNGPISAFLCSNLGNGPAGTPSCPVDGGTVRGTIRADQVTAGAAAQGLDAGELDELIDAMRAGATYVNVHTAERPTGEIRGQLDRHGGHRR